MRRKKWTPEQILEILRAADAPGVSIEEVCRIYQVSRWNVFRWRRQHEGGQVDQTKTVRTLEQENQRLKQLLATRDLELDAMKRLVQKNSLRHSNGGRP